MKLNEVLNDVSANIDIFGSNVGVNFKGRSTVTSKLGAIVTLLTFGLGVAYLTTLVIRLVQRQDP